jgi:hypothetical protein
LKQLFKDTDIFSLPEAQKQELELLGNNQKAILVVLRVTEWNQAMHTFLGKILGAVQVNVDEDTHCLNITNHASISFSQLHQKHPYQRVICFGLKPKELGLNIEETMYRPFTLSDVQWLFAHNLQTIYEERQEGKKQMAGALWKALKEMFELV